jgi:hypothetical protein
MLAAGVTPPKSTAKVESPDYGQDKAKKPAPRK